MAEVKIVVTAQDRASGPLGRIGSALGGMATVAGGIIAAGAITKIASGLTAAGTAGLSFNNSMEQVTARLNAFTKDGTATAEIMDMIRDRAAQTPFAFEEMANAAAALMPAAKQSGAALEGLIEQAEILAASNPAEGLEGAAFSLKEALGGDFVSAIERFNLSRQYINDLKEQGVPNLEIISKAMAQMGLDTDLVSNLAATAEGRWSTFKDTLVGLAAEVTKPVFDLWSAGLGKVNDMIAANAPLIESMAAALSGKLQDAINWVSTTGIPAIVEFGEAFAGDLQTAIDWIGSTGLPILRRFGEAFIMPSWENFINNILPVFTDNLQTFISWMQATGIPAAKEFGTAFAIPALDTLANETMPALLKVSQEFWGWVGETAIPLLQQWGQAFATGLAPHITTLSTKLSNFANVIAPKLQEVWDKLLVLWNKISPVLTKMAEAMGLNNENTGKLFEALGSLVGFLVEVQLDLILDTITVAVDLLSAALDGAAVMFDTANAVIGKFAGIWDGIAAKINGVKTAIEGLLPTLPSLGSLMPDFLIPGSPTPFERGLAGIAGAFNDVARQINPMAGALGGLNGMQPLALGAGGNLGSLQAVRGELMQIYALTNQLNAAGVNLNINSTGNVAIGRGSNQGQKKLGGMTRL